MTAGRVPDRDARVAVQRRPTMTSHDPLPSTVSRRDLLATGAAAAAVVAAGAGVTGAGTSETDEDRQRTFTAELSPDAAVPADGENRPYDERDASGEATLELARTGSELAWTVTLSNVRCATGCHVHEGGAGENGPHLAELFNLSAPSDRLDGARWEGSFGEGDVCGSAKNDCLPAGVAFDDLVGAMRAGETYVQAHMTDGRVIRGQLE